MEGNVAIQAFTIVTASPAFLNFDFNDEPNRFNDSITLKAIVEVEILFSMTLLIIILNRDVEMGNRLNFKFSSKNIISNK